MSTAAPAAEQAFLADICADPGDDVPRLIYADFLDDRGGPGDAARAEFIRVQCELAGVDDGSGRPPVQPNNAGMSPERWHALRRRERQLLGANEGRWLGWLTAAWGAEWVPARECGLAWRRGFVAGVTLPTADFLRHAAALFGAQPVEAVTLSDKCPYSATGRDRWLWFPGLGGWHVLPWKLFAALPGGEVVPPHGRAGTARLYPTVADARAALSAAAVAYGRAAAGLPPP